MWLIIIDWMHTRMRPITECARMVGMYFIALWGRKCCIYWFILDQTYRTDLKIYMFAFSILLHEYSGLSTRRTIKFNPFTVEFIRFSLCFMTRCFHTWMYDTDKFGICYKFFLCVIWDILNFAKMIFLFPSRFRFISTSPQHSVIKFLWNSFQPTPFFKVHFLESRY